MAKQIVTNAEQLLENLMEEETSISSKMKEIVAAKQNINNLKTQHQKELKIREGILKNLTKNQTNFVLKTFEIIFPGIRGDGDGQVPSNRHKLAFHFYKSRNERDNSESYLLGIMQLLGIEAKIEKQNAGKSFESTTYEIDSNSLAQKLFPLLRGNIEEFHDRVQALYKQTVTQRLDEVKQYATEAAQSGKDSDIKRFQKAAAGLSILAQNKDYLMTTKRLEDRHWGQRKPSSKQITQELTQDIVAAWLAAAATEKENYLYTSMHELNDKSKVLEIANANSEILEYLGLKYKDDYRHGGYSLGNIERFLSFIANPEKLEQHWAKKDGRVEKPNLLSNAEKILAQRKSGVRAVQ